MTVIGVFLWKSVGAVLLSVVPVTVRTNSGEIVRADLAGFQSDAVLLNDGNGIQEYPFDDLAALQSDEFEERSGRAYRVTLTSGSRIAAQAVRFSEDELLIEPRRQDPIRVPIKLVRAIRFRAPLIATDAQWLGLIDQESRGDTLVIRRPGDRLDPQPGVVIGIDDGTVVFDLDGQQINAPIDRLEGIVFGGTSAVDDTAEIQVLDTYGSRWSVRSIEPSQGDQPLQMRLSSSILHPLPVHQIERIRWTGGVTLLAGEEAAASEFRPYFATSVDPQLLGRFFEPRQEGEEDMLLHGGSSVQYRIEPGHRLFAGSFRRHDRIEKASSLTIRIEFDGREVWQQRLNDAKPRGFELPVDRSRRLAIHVECDRDGCVGDTVQLLRPRLLK